MFCCNQRCFYAVAWSKKKKKKKRKIPKEESYGSRSFHRRDFSLVFIIIIII